MSATSASGSARPVTMAVACVGSFMLLLDTSIVVLALPKIQADLGASISQLQWITDAYILPLAAFMLTCGTIGDRLGRKKLFMAGLTIFTIGSLVSGLANSIGLLFAGRALQGIGAAALSPGALSILVAAFSDPKSRAQSIGAWSGISAIALAIGPVVGGLLVAVATWRGIFLVNVPIGIIALIVAALGVRDSRNQDARHIDAPGQVLVVLGLLCLVGAVIEGGSLGWGSPLVLGGIVVGAAFIIAFLVLESRSKEPLLPLNLFRLRSFSVATFIGFVGGFTVLSSIFFIAQFFEEVQGDSVLTAGLKTLPISVGAFVFAPIAGGLAGRIGCRLPIVVGALLTGAGLLLFAMTLTPTTGFGSVWWMLALMGVGMGLLLSPATAAVLASTPPNRVGLGSSTFTTSNELGNTIGVAVIGALVVRSFAGGLATRLSQLGLQGDVQATANRIAEAGVQAGGNPHSVHVALSAGAVQEAVREAFVSALHDPLIASACVLFLGAIVTAALFKEAPRPDAAVAPLPANAAVTASGDGEA